MFQAAAKELGLEVERMPHYGCALTRLANTTAAPYSAGIAECTPS